MFDKIKDRLEKYSEKITETGCQIWTGASQKGERGCLRNENKVVEAAHRLSFRMSRDLKEIPDNLFVLHKCDIGSCINPDHLFLGTQLDNIRDMDNKGRRVNWYPSGNLNPNYKHGNRMRKI